MVSKFAPFYARVTFECIVKVTRENPELWGNVLLEKICEEMRAVAELTKG